MRGVPSFSSGVWSRVQLYTYTGVYVELYASAPRRKNNNIERGIELCMRRRRSDESGRPVKMTFVLEQACTYTPEDFTEAFPRHTNVRRHSPRRA